MCSWISIRHWKKNQKDFSFWVPMKDWKAKLEMVYFSALINQIITVWAQEDQTKGERTPACLENSLVMHFSYFFLQNYCPVHLVCIRSVSIDVEYQNCCRTLDLYLLFVILLGQIKSKVSYRLVTYKLVST